MLEIFLSHHGGNRDQPFISSLAALLPAYGIKPFLAEIDLRPGVEVSRKISEALDASELVVVCLTKDGQASGAVNQEIGYAVKAGKFVIPLVEKGVKPTLFVHGIDWIEYDPENPGPAMTKCVDVLNKIHASKLANLERAMMIQRERDAVKTFLAVVVLVGLVVLLLVAVSRSNGVGFRPALPAPA